MIRKLLFALAPLALVTLACAEERTVLAWPEAVREAAQQNPELASAMKSLAASQASLKQSWNGIFPRVGLSGSYGRSKNDTPQSSRWNIGGNASVDIFNMNTYAAIAGANAAVDQSEASLRSTASNVLFSLRSAFVTLLFSQTEENVSDTIKDIRDTNARMVQLRYQSGRESKGNMLRANAEQIQAAADLSQAKREVIADQQEFSRRLGWDEPKIVIATGALSLDGYQLDAREIIPPLVDINPTVLLAEARLKSADSAVAAARSNLYPNLSASYSRTNFGPTYFPDNPTWSANGTLSYPIFGNGPTGTFNAISAAKRNREASEQDLRAARTQVRSQLETAWSNLAGAIDTIQVQEAFLLAARQRNDEADIRYTSGLMSYEDWTVIVSDRVTYERSVVRARRDGLLALAQWNNTVGRELGNEQ